MTHLERSACCDRSLTYCIRLKDKKLIFARLKNIELSLNLKCTYGDTRKKFFLLTLVVVFFELSFSGVFVELITDLLRYKGQTNVYRDTVGCCMLFYIFTERSKQNKTKWS